MTGKTTKKYTTILADPPWRIDQLGNYGAVNHYQLLPLEKIKALPVGDLSEDNAHCWLWVTQGTLRHGYDVLEAWGFAPKSIYVWAKLRLGLGNYLRVGTEFCLLGVKGKLPVKFKAQPNFGIFPVQDHSHKPEEFHKIIERVSPGPYLELFARRRQPGWDVWGNEIESDVEIPGYPVPKYGREEK